MVSRHCVTHMIYNISVSLTTHICCRILLDRPLCARRCYTIYCRCATTWTGRSLSPALQTRLYHVIELYRRSIRIPSYAVSSLM